MDVVFLGTPAFAVPTLEALIASSRHRVVGVVTQPDRRAGRGNKLVAPPVKTCAEAAGLAVLQPDDVNTPEAIDWIGARSAEVGVVVAFGQFLARAVRETPPRGFINLHASLLPAYRGAAPIHAAIRDGCDATGVSIMRVERRLDAGPVLDRMRLDIGPDENVGELSERLSREGAALLADVLDRLERDAVGEVPQDDASATHAAKITAADRAVPWARGAREVHDHVRGLTPHPGATARFAPAEGAPFAVRVTRTALVPPDPEGGGSAGGARSGDVLGRADDGLRVAVGDGAVILVRRLVPAGGREISGVEFATGRGRGGGRFVQGEQRHGA